MPTPRSTFTKKLSACTAALGAIVGVVLSPPARAETPARIEASRPAEKAAAPRAPKNEGQVRTADVAVKRALARATPIVDLSRSTTHDERSTTIVTSSGHGVAPQNSDPVATATSETVIEASSALASTETVRGPTAPKDKPVARPPATERILRRINAGRPSFDADMHACADEHGNRDATTLTLQLSVSPEGWIEDVQLAPTSVAPAVSPLLTCVIAAIAKSRFGRPGPAGASVALRVIVPAAKPPVQPEAVATEPNAVAGAKEAPASVPN